MTTQKTIDKPVEEKPKKEKVPTILYTSPIRLSRSKPIVPIKLLFPPGIRTFYVERLSKNKIRFLIKLKEITAVADMAIKKRKQIEKKIKEGMAEIKKTEGQA